MKLTILITVILVLLCTSIAKAQPATAYHSAAEARTIVLINQIRAQHGLHSLRLDPKLAHAAREHSTNMLTRGYFDHDGPDGTFEARLDHFAPRRACVAENIALGSGSYSKAAGIVNAWMHSAGHRDVILTPQLRRVGVGVAYGTWQGDAGVALATADFSS